MAFSNKAAMGLFGGLGALGGMTSGWLSGESTGTKIKNAFLGGLGGGIGGVIGGPLFRRQALRPAISFKPKIKANQGFRLF
jgi:hypothetical protein